MRIFMLLPFLISEKHIERIATQQQQQQQQK